MLSFIIWISLFFKATVALENGVGRLPPMGYNTYNFYGCNGFNEEVVLSTARALKHLGLLELGYSHVNVDDCWSLKSRNEAGELVADPVKFPNGMLRLANGVREIGATFGSLTLHICRGRNFFLTPVDHQGIYGDAGLTTCSGYPGNWGHEKQDAATYASWNISMLKYDNCAIPANETRTQQEYYAAMRDALLEQPGDPILFAACQWGQRQGWEWGNETANSFRITGDIQRHWSYNDPANNINSVTSIINFASFITSYTGFYGHNDLDMLQIGNGFNEAEERSHFGFWALMKSPLIIGTNMSSISTSSLSILKNKDLIAINQDPIVGESITPFNWDFTFNSLSPAKYWSGRTSFGTVVAVLNPADNDAAMAFKLSDSPWLKGPGVSYMSKNLWTGKKNV